MSNPFNTPTMQDHEKDYHVIVTTHPQMLALGLNVFTTGNLYGWMNQKDGNGDYKNQILLDGAGMNEVLGGNYADEPNWGSWYGWRKSGATGAYKYQNHSSWSWTWQDLAIDYTASDLFTWTIGSTVVTTRYK